jgi:hypothetical protein
MKKRVCVAGDAKNRCGVRYRFQPCQMFHPPCVSAPPHVQDIGRNPMQPRVVRNCLKNARYGIDERTDAKSPAWRMRGGALETSAAARQALALKHPRYWFMP